MSLLDAIYKTKKISANIYDELKAKNLSDLQLEEEILKRNILDENSFMSIKADFFHLPYKFVEPQSVPSDIFSLIQEETASFYQFIPFKKEGQKVEIGIVNPGDIRTLDALKFIAHQKNLEFKIFLISKNNFNEISKKYSSLKEEVREALQEFSTEELPEEVIEEKKMIYEEAPVIKITSVILKHAFESNASDIHIESLSTKSRVRFRIDGVLYTNLSFPKEIHESLVARIKIMANLRIDEKRIPQDGRFKVKINNKEVNFRVSIYPTQLGEKIQLRLLDPTVGIKTLAELGIRGRNLNLIETNIKKPFGLVLSTGPTGSGKTSTLYSILNLLNKDTVNILTLEDPVEYYLEGINQSQIKPEIGYTFASGLRTIVRQDPDIIMVGEIRDPETAALTIHSALTGHIVLSTLHTNNSVGIVPRLLEMGVERYLMPTTLNLAIAQRLVKTLCPHCKKAVKMKDDFKKIIEKEFAQMPSILESFKLSSESVLYEPVGCNKCANKGNRGRTGIFEVLEINEEIEEIILKDPTESKLKEAAEKQGMVTMKQDGIIKAVEGLVSLEEVFVMVKN